MDESRDADQTWIAELHATTDRARLFCSFFFWVAFGFVFSCDTGTVFRFPKSSVSTSFLQDCERCPPRFCMTISKQTWSSCHAAVVFATASGFATGFLTASCSTSAFSRRFPGLFTGHVPTRGSGQESSERHGSDRIGSGRAGSGQEVLEISRVGSGRVRSGHVGSGRVRTCSKSH